MIQFKLKVDLSPEVMLKVNDGKEGVTPSAKQNEIFNTVKGNIADKMIRDNRHEESKEKPDIQ